MVWSSFLEDEPGFEWVWISTFQVCRILKFSILFGFDLVWFNTISKKYDCWRRANGNFSLMISLPTNAATKHTNNTETQHITYETCVYCIWPAKFWLGFFLMFVSLLKIFFFWEEKKVPSCISPLSKKASEEVFIMCTLKKIGFIIWCGTVS